MNRHMGLATAEEMVAVARLVRGRADLVLAENDEYSSPGLKQRLIDALDASDRTLVLEQTRHNVGNSPLAVRRSFARLVEIAQSHSECPRSSAEPCTRRIRP
ncbi:MAG: hypothetical protein JWO25_474 [Alphaproteobacteria bacterium]|nr:hypothetical protein [Alphaproteobacteria bacterium]